MGIRVDLNELKRQFIGETVGLFISKFKETHGNSVHIHLFYAYYALIF